ncbi:hypothetical protein HG537_0A05700 [Torulaspora globosa]|uniref:Histone-lysine N-methyltransferase, H3 lysine-79 specific n=1 Tax=Torulaspora globosa TaxID=48254 RepID=A0A7H9HM01_9SACH|nr:hypothetical protein HG537_0A05700 [Torulaspora sp. CBS 2947]
MSMLQNEHSGEETSSIFSSPKTASTTTSSIDASDSSLLEDMNSKVVKDGKPIGKKKGRHLSSLEALLNEANRYNSQYEYTLPRGFLRQRNQSKKFNEESQLESKVVKKTVTKSKKAKMNLEASKTEIKASSGKVKRNRSRSSSRSPAEDNDVLQMSQSDELDSRTTEDNVKRHVSNSKEVNFIDWNQKSTDLKYDIFDIANLRTEQDFNDIPVPSISLTSKRYKDDSGVLKVALRSPLYPTYSEEYHVDFSRESRIYNSMSEIGKLIEYSALIYLPEKYADELKRSIIPELNAAFDSSDDLLFAAKIDEYNRLIETVPRDEVIEHLAQLKTMPPSFIHDLLHIVYTRSIHPNYKKLKEYEAFSNYVYGELLPNFLSNVYSQCGLNSNSIFMDLGSGVGNCVVQAALEYGCKLSFGCEIMSNASALTELQNEELIKRCKLTGLKFPKLEFSLRKSFINNDRVNELIPQSDVILINNFLFDSDMNQQVEKIIQNVKVGCKIITLKNLRPCGYTINFFNLDSILNRLHVQRFELKEGSVSWTHNGGEYFISTVLPDVDDSLFDPTLRKRNTKRPKHYTR